VIRKIIILVVLGVAIVAGSGCVSESYASAEEPEVQWAKEVTVKCAEQAIGYKILPNLDDHHLTTEPAGTIGRTVHDFRVKGTVYREYDGRGYDVSATFRVQELAGQNIDVEMRLMSVNGKRVEIPELTARF